jgi:DNA-binding NtrC family response regulator
MILGDGEENLSSLMNSASTNNGSAKTASSGEMVVSGPQAFDPKEFSDLSALSLKKMRKKAMDQVEREVISYVLQKTAWNRSKATKILKISYKTLLYKIKDLGIHPPPDALE